MQTVFIIGNGESRKDYPLAKLKKYGQLYGCNAIYRDHATVIDTLVAVDVKMILEIDRNIKKIPGEIVTRKRNINKPFRELIWRKSGKTRKDDGWSSGQVAMIVACEEHEDLENMFLIGFDLYGVKGLQNNVYKGTKHYREASLQETFWGNWVHQMFLIMKRFSKINFWRVGNVRDKFPDEWSQGNLQNIKFITYEEMHDKLKDMEIVK